MSRLTIALLCLFAFGCGPTPPFTPFDSYSAGEAAAYGYVTDLYDCGLEGARVLVSGSELGSESDQSGRYRMRIRSSSTYVLKVELSGFASDSALIEVGGEPTRQDFELVPSRDCGDKPCPAYRPPCVHWINR